MSKNWPPLPKSVHGVGGAIRIELVPFIENEAGKPAVGDNSTTFGMWEGHKRLIRIVDNVPRAFQWSVLYHEMVHAALFDAGLTNLMTHENEEALCDCISTARIAEMRG